MAQCEALWVLLDAVGFFCTSHAFVKGSFSVYIGIKFSFEAELTGLILAIEIAYKFN